MSVTSHYNGERTGEMFKWLRVLASVPEEMSLVAWTHTRWLITAYRCHFRGSDSSSGMHTDRQTCTHITKVKLNLKEKWQIWSSPAEQCVVRCLTATLSPATLTESLQAPPEMTMEFGWVHWVWQNGKYDLIQQNERLRQAEWQGADLGVVFKARPWKRLSSANGLWGALEPLWVEWREPWWGTNPGGGEGKGRCGHWHLSSLCSHSCISFAALGHRL